MYVYTTINTQIFVCIQIYYHSCKSYKRTYKQIRLYVKVLFQILIICKVKVNVSPLKLNSSLLSSSK